MVDGLEHRMGPRLEVAHVDIGTDEGRVVAARYGVAGVPAFIVLDGRGTVVFRQVGGRPRVAEIEAKIEASNSAATRQP